MDQIKKRLITSNQLKYKRLQFEVAKQEPNESLWEFENCLHYLQKQANITDNERFVETYKKGILNNKLREHLMVREPPITTKTVLKEAVQDAQMGLLKYVRTFNNPPAAAMAGLGALQREDLETRRRTNRQIVELQRRFGPRNTNSVEDKMPMELDAMQRARDDDEEYYSDNSNEEADDALFFMEPDHDKIRSKEDPETQDYWEAGIMTDTISALKIGNMDHSQKSCYH